MSQVLEREGMSMVAPKSDQFDLFSSLISAAINIGIGLKACSSLYLPNVVLVGARSSINSRKGRIA